VQRVIKLALETPFEVGVVQVARMEIKKIRVDGQGSVFELDDDFDAVAFGAGAEVQEGVLVKSQLSKHTLEPGVGGRGHARIVNAGNKAPAAGGLAGALIVRRGVSSPPNCLI